jgi:hypothetical protein
MLNNCGIHMPVGNSCIGQDDVFIKSLDPMLNNCGIHVPVGNSGIGQDYLFIKLLDPMLNTSVVFICRWEIQA